MRRGLPLLLLALWLAACGGEERDRRVRAPDGPAAPVRLGEGEGRVDLVAPPGHVEDEWVRAYEAQTGCEVRARVASTAGQLEAMVRSGAYDGVAAPGDVAAALVQAG